jgi:hypothetical protein
MRLAYHCSTGYSIGFSECFTSCGRIKKRRERKHIVSKSKKIEKKRKRVVLKKRDTK